MKKKCYVLSTWEFGLTVVAKKEYASKIIEHVKSHGINAYEIGKIVKGNKQVIVEGKFDWNM